MGLTARILDAVELYGGGVASVLDNVEPVAVALDLGFEELPRGSAAPSRTLTALSVNTFPRASILTPSQKAKSPKPAEKRSLAEFCHILKWNSLSCFAALVPSRCFLSDHFVSILTVRTFGKWIYAVNWGNDGIDNEALRITILIRFK